MSKPTFATICKMILVRQYYNGGASVSEIAQAAGVRPAKVREWLNITATAGNRKAGSNERKA